MSTKALRPQQHGGALQSGHPRAPGPMPSTIRNGLRGSFSERVPVLEQIADGECVQRAQIPLLLVLPHTTCPNCGQSPLQVRPEEAKDAHLISISGMVSASPSDRLKAVDLMGKYGMGTLKAFAEDEVKAKLHQMLLMIRHWEALADAAPELERRMGMLWTGKATVTDDGRYTEQSK